MYIYLTSNQIKDVTYNCVLVTTDRWTVNK